MAGSVDRAPSASPKHATADGRPVATLRAGPDETGDAEGLRLALAIALSRPPSETELHAFLEWHEALSNGEAAEWAAFPVRWAALTDPVERVVGYERHGARAYCALNDLLPPRTLGEAFSLDPIVAARCRDGEQFVLRKSGLDVALGDIAFAAELTGTEGLARADVASLGSRLADYFSGDGGSGAVENWSRATSRHVRLRLQWAALGRTEVGRQRRRSIIARLRAGGEAPVQRADVLRSRTWREYAKADFGQFMAGLNRTGRDEVEGSLSLNCVLASATTCY